MAQVDRIAGCCGIRSLWDIQTEDPAEVIVEAWEEIDNEGLSAPFIMFADNTENRSGHRLARYIKKHKLGSINRTRPALNPNSDNMLVIWLWKIDEQAVRRHVRSLE